MNNVTSIGIPTGDDTLPPKMTPADRIEAQRQAVFEVQAIAQLASTGIAQIAGSDCGNESVVSSTMYAMGAIERLTNRLAEQLEMIAGDVEGQAG